VEFSEIYVNQFTDRVLMPKKKHLKNANQGTFSFLSVAVAHMMLAKASFASIPLSLQRSLYV
jgi:hypothetical protein